MSVVDLTNSIATQKVAICNPDGTSPVNVEAALVDGSGTALALTGSYSHLTAAATTVIKSGAGVLFAVIVNNPGLTITLTLYDNTAGSGTVMAVIALTASANLQYGMNFGVGLTAVLSGTADVTIVYA